MNATTSSKLTWAMGFFAAFLLWPSVNFAQVASSYSGDALAAQGNIGVNTFDIDHLSLPLTGGGGSFSQSDSAPPSLPGGGCVGNCGEGGSISVSTTGSGPSTLSTAAVDTLTVKVGSHTIMVNVGGLSTTASAICPLTLGDTASVTTGGYVGEVNIDGIFDSLSGGDLYGVNFPAFPGIIDSQSFPLGLGGADGMVYVNKIITNGANSSGGDITINAIEIDTPTDQVVVASSHAGVTCPRVTSGGGGSGGCPGKVTGGGVFMLNGQRQTFGFVAGTKKDGTAFGNFNYVNHGTKDHLQGSVESVTVDNSAVPPTATVTGTLKVNGTTVGPYTWVVTDAGQPGRADTVSLTSGPLSTPAPISLDPRGGNIKIHKGCGVGSSH